MAKIDMNAVVKATLAGSFVHVSEKDAKKLVADGMIELNPTITDASGNVAARATQKGIDSVNTPANPATSAAPTFTFVTGPALEKPKRGAGRASAIPFADFPAPDAQGNTTRLFIPATEKTPEPWKSLSSTVSAASRSFATVTGTKPGKNKNGEEIQRNVYSFARKFALVEGEQNGVKGAWIERVK